MERLLEYASRHPWLVGATALALLLVIAWELRSRAQSFAAVSPQEAISLMNQRALLLDIRTPEKFAAGHIGGAKHMSSELILKARESLAKHIDKPIIVYCDAGSLGASAARQLTAQGFTRVFNLRGGFAAWRAESLPVTKDTK